MVTMEDLQELFDTEQLINKDLIMGDPIFIKDTALLPFFGVMYGMGVSSDKGDRVGFYARLSPKAVMVVKDGGKVEFFPIKSNDVIEKLTELVPDALARIKNKKQRTE
ncbi:MAG: hypothetical protein PWQ82_851 [Thermosediminibacterales bacterium]|nr:hypothetical protein [Thermosediminibacterales bacterium]MDK2835938.1 hypothetical protein [Thermosediminibacterales bacterium]